MEPISPVSWRRSASARLIAWIVIAAPVGAQGPELAFDALRCERPSAGELTVAAELAEARADLAATGALFAEGWTVGAAAGPRRLDSGESETDVAFEASAPLLAGGDVRDRLAASFEQAAAVLPEAARLETRSDLAALYAEAWAAERIEALRAESLAAADEWLALARRRSAEGADAPFQAELVAVERREAAIAHAAARAERRTAWSALATRCELPAEPQPLAPPGWTPAADAAAIASRSAAAAAFRAVDLRAELASAAVELDAARDRSRWLLRGEAAQEGDEDVARVGFAYRFPRSGESAALDARRASELARIARVAELESAALAARLAAAHELRAATSEGEEASDIGSAATIASIRTALEALITEGRSRASEIVPLRRQLLAAEISEVERAAAVARAAAEIEYLTTEVQP